ncbi:MAG TPA: hypothetical protein VJ934_09490 [Desulfomicrobiaceae bacterium]|nr:hypothetical protein [Desulfomicrobiaceae bacterium]
MMLRRGVSVPVVDATADRRDTLRRLAFLVYGLQGLSFLFGITSIIGVVIAYLNRRDAQDRVIRSHFDWQIRTFWFSLLWGLLCSLTFYLGIGMIGGGILTVWFIYRVVRGWMALREETPMYSYRR